MKKWKVKAVETVENVTIAVGASLAVQIAVEEALTVEIAVEGARLAVEIAVGVREKLAARTARTAIRAAKAEMARRARSSTLPLTKPNKRRGS